ncbi:hypothetical protein D3C71_2219080 [compost metagenome]
MSKLLGCCPYGLPEFRRGEVFNHDTHRDHKHVGDAVFETAGDEHADRQDHGEHFVHQAAA